MKKISDNELVKRILEGQIDAYREIVDRHQARVFYMGLKFFHNRHDAEDYAQEVFLNPDCLVPLRRANPEVSPATEGAILAAMGPHPGNRPPTVEAWLHLLRGGELPAGERRAGPPQADRRPSVWDQLWRESGWLLVLCVLLTVLVLYLTFR